VYFLYNYKRGTFYPFVPAGGKSRDNERELRLKAQLSHEMPFEAELERWFPALGHPDLASGLRGRELFAA